MEIRRSYDRLISTTGFSILIRRHLYIESRPRLRLCSSLRERWMLSPSGAIPGRLYDGNLAGVVVGLKESWVDTRFVPSTASRVPTGAALLQGLCNIERYHSWENNPDSKAHGAHLGPVGPRWAHVGPLPPGYPQAPHCCKDSAT